MADDDRNDFDKPLVSEESSEEEMEILKEVLETDKPSAPDDQVFSTDLFAEQPKGPRMQAEEGQPDSADESLLHPSEADQQSDDADQDAEAGPGPEQEEDIKVFTDDDLRSLFEEGMPDSSDAESDWQDAKEAGPEKSREEEVDEKVVEIETQTSSGPDPEIEEGAERETEQKQDDFEDTETDELFAPHEEVVEEIGEPEATPGSPEVESQQQAPEKEIPEAPEQERAADEVEVAAPASDDQDSPEEGPGLSDEDSMSPLPEEVEEIDFEDEDLEDKFFGNDKEQEDTVPEEASAPEFPAEPGPPETFGEEEEPEGPDEAPAPESAEPRELTEDVLENLEKEAQVGDFAAVAAAKKGDMLKTTEDRLSGLEPAECDFMSVDELKKLFENVNLLIQWVKETSERIAELEKKVDELAAKKEDE